MRHEAAGAATELFPKQLTMRGVSMPLSYHFEPGSARDGVTLSVPLFALNQVDAQRCEWLVPGMLKEKVAQLLKSLPQRLRRACVPLAAYASGFIDRHRLAPESPAPSLLEALLADLREHANVACTVNDFKLEMVPVHLIMNFKVVDEAGRQLAMGRNLSALRSEFAAQVQHSFRELTASATKEVGQAAPAITDWDFGPLPQVQEIRRGGQVLIGYPALVDQGTHCTLEVFDDPQAAREAHRAGLRRLFRLQLRPQLQSMAKTLSSLAAVQMRATTAAAMKGLEPLAEQVATAALDRVCVAEPWPTDRTQFLARRDEARGRLALVAQELARLAEQVVEEALGIQRKLAALRAGDAARADIEQQLARLLARRFVADTPPQSLAQLPRYLQAIGLRLEKLRADPSRDQARMRELAPLQTRWLREVAARKGVSDPQLDEFGWLLEELRVSLFAQELRTPFPVSVKRLEKVWASVQR